MAGESTPGSALRPVRPSTASRKRLIYEFNVLPAINAHPSWLGNDLPPNPDRARQLTCSHRLLVDHGLVGNYDWVMRSAVSRVALLQRTAFRRVCLALGALAYGMPLRRVIDGAQVRQIESLLGDLIAAAWDPMAERVAAFCQPTVLFQPTMAAWIDQLQAAGERLYDALLKSDTSVSPAARIRAQFRLPMPLADERPLPVAREALDPLTHWVRATAIRRWEPRWVWLFS